MLFTQMLFLGDAVLWYCQEGLMKEASEAIYQAVPEQDVFLGLFACPLN